MGSFILTRKAVSDLSDIWNYTYDNWSEDQADKYYKLLTDNFQKIAEDPEIGKRYKTIADNLFGLKAGKHIIFYRKLPSEKQIEITRILHESMDLKSRIKE